MVVLKLNPQLLLQQEQTIARSSVSSPGAPSSPAPSSPAPSDIDSEPAPVTTTKRKSSSTGPSSAGAKRKRISMTPAPSSPLLLPTVSDVSATGTPAPNPPPSHHAPHSKLGPKANQGSINAQLRALDRTGKPCRRWTKAPLELKSFTGWEWSTVSWAGDQKYETAGSYKQDENAKDGSSALSAPPAPPPLTITIPSLNKSKSSKDPKNPVRFPAILLKGTLEDFSA
ncbi:INO80 complex subunit Ies4-domain-containing protein [Kockiozyma suomiensis]|uniref:INO80 complex subunit Ies4-domain-containing protein n=1 Tax=Kockiozyma suomiensis TaxID=1337062 RepID=UPI003343EA51